MMKEINSINIFKSILTVLMSITMAFTTTCIGVNACEETFVDDNQQVEFVENYPEEIAPYAEELDKINQELGTKYTFDFSDYSHEDLQKYTDFYTNMDLDEFYTYAKKNILEIEEILSDDIELIPISDSSNSVNEILNDSIITPYSTRSIQSWYYNGTTSGNYVRIATWVNYYDGTAYYDDTYQINIVSNERVTTSSAYFYVTGISDVVYQTDKRSVIMKLSGTKYPIQGASYSFSKTVTFDAGQSYISGAISNY